MDCPTARIAIIRRMADDLSPERAAELDSHLAACPRCTERAGQYGKVRDSVRALPAPELPEQVVEACDRALEKVTPGDLPSSGPPADPQPVAGFWKRAAILSVCLLALAGIAVGAVLVAAHLAEPVQQTGHITYRAGTVEAGYPGGLQWSEAPPLPEVYEDTILRTGTDGYLRVRAEGATWWMDSNTTIAFPQPRTARLAQGRVMARIGSRRKQPTLLTSPNGATVESREGVFALRASPARLIVTCLSGRATVRGREKQTILSAGERTMVAEGRLAETARPSRTRHVAGWKRRFGADPQRALTRDQAPLLPFPPETTLLPEGVRVEKLTIRTEIRGPLLLNVVTARLSNRSDDTWRGTLDAADLFWPAPAASVPGRDIEVTPGQTAAVHSAALGTMLASGTDLTFGLVPAGWTGESIREMRIELVGDAGAFGSARCTTRQLEFRKGEDRLPARATLREVTPERPIVFEFEPQGTDRTDTVLLRGPESTVTLGAWRPGFKEDPAIGQARHFLLAFDAAAQYGVEGRSYAHALAEQITQRLSRRARLMVAAYDGQIKLLPSPAPTAGPMGRERMMASLWDLDGAGPQDPGALLRWCASFPAREPSVAFVVSDGQAGTDEFPVPSDGSRPRTFLIRTHPGRDAPGAGRLCASLRGAALHLPGGLPAEAAALHALRNVTWPGYEKLHLKLRSPAGADGRVLTPPGTPSNAPVIWVVVSSGGAEGVSGHLSAATGEHDKATTFRTPPAGKDIIAIADVMERRLVAELKELLRESATTTARP